MKEITLKNFKKFLPNTLSKYQVLSANSKKININCWRAYKYGKYKVDLPPNVFSLGGTSENIFKLIESKKVNVSGKSVCVVGAGAGIEGCLLLEKGVGELVETDIHSASVRTQRNLLRKYFPKNKNYKSIKSDLFISDYFRNKKI